MNNILFTKVKFNRNVKDYKFVPKLTNENKEELMTKLKELIGSKMSLISLNSADANMIQFLETNRLLNVNSNNIFVSLKENLAINLFVGEHINLIATGFGYDREVFTRAKDMANYLSSKINMSFSDEYGYLMSDISKIGAGVEIECDICLDSIKSINKIDQVKQNMRKLGYILRSTKNPSIYTLSTACNLGFSEQEIFDEFDKVVFKLNDLEIESAKMLDMSKHDELLDKARRSLAILNSAYLLSYDELANSLLNIRTGLNLGLIEIDESTLAKLQRLVFDKNDEFVSQSELKNLAKKVSTILKGE